jgi:hypothetical protein
MSELSGDAAEQEREMREHERKAQEHESAERSPEAADDAVGGARPGPPGNADVGGGVGGGS